MTYEQALDYIHSVVWKGSRPGLSRITELLEKLNNPQDDLRFVHIAGTNGKGSTAAMTEAVLRAAGYRTGLFVSPFIKHFNERIQYCGRPIDHKSLAEATAAVRPFADAMEDAPTEFELITAIGFVYFKKMSCDVVVLETGMGGRLDSTNVIKNPLLTVITGIAMDHTAYLGDTVEQIAAEKAGIIKKGCPVVWGGFDRAARAVIEARAAALDAPFVAAEDTPPTDVITDLEGTTLSRGEHRRVHIPLLGAYQPQNLCTVLAALDLLRARGLAISEEALHEGLSSVKWRGRFERLSRTPLIFSDGAHNPEGITAATRSIRTYFPHQRVLILTGMMADKAYEQMAGELAAVAEEAFTITPDNPRSLAAEELAEVFRGRGVKATAFASVDEAVAAAVARAKVSGLPLFSLGSLYMYAEVTDALHALGVL